MKETTSVLVADSQPTLAEALSLGLGRCAYLEILDPRPTNAVDAIKSVTATRPDVAVLDYWLEGMAAPALVASLKETAPGTTLLVLGWFCDPGQIQEVLASGAAGFVSKASQVVEVDAAIHRVVRGEEPTFSPDVARELEALEVRFDHGSPDAAATRKMLAQLTPRKLEILGLLAGGWEVEKIARELKIGRQTVRNHVQDILNVTMAHGRLEAVAIARRHGFSV